MNFPTSNDKPVRSDVGRASEPDTVQLAVEVDFEGARLINFAVAVVGESLVASERF